MATPLAHQSPQTHIEKQSWSQHVEILRLLHAKKRCGNHSDMAMCGYQHPSVAGKRATSLDRVYFMVNRDRLCLQYGLQ